MQPDDRIIVGYHGTSTAVAARILESGAFARSANDWDWLGHGIYFWEGAGRAWEWADDEFGHQAAAVLCVPIHLGHCCDLTDSRFVSMLQIAYAHIKKSYDLAKKPLPTNSRNDRRLDCLLFNYLSDKICHFDTIRALFIEGEPIYPGTTLRTRQHIQINVRNTTCITARPEPVPR